MVSWAGCFLKDRSSIPANKHAHTHRCIADLVYWSTIMKHRVFFVITTFALLMWAIVAIQPTQAASGPGGRLGPILAAPPVPPLRLSGPGGQAASIIAGMPERSPPARPRPYNKPGHPAKTRAG